MACSTPELSMSCSVKVGARTYVIMTYLNLQAFQARQYVKAPLQRRQLMVWMGYTCADADHKCLFAISWTGCVAPTIATASIDQWADTAALLEPDTLCTNKTVPEAIYSGSHKLCLQRQIGSCKIQSCLYADVSDGELTPQTMSTHQLEYNKVSGLGNGL